MPRQALIELLHALILDGLHCAHESQRAPEASAVEHRSAAVRPPAQPIFKADPSWFYTASACKSPAGQSAPKVVREPRREFDDLACDSDVLHVYCRFHLDSLLPG